MRRALTIGLAIFVLMIATRGVVAQEQGDNVSDRLLEILKERSIISEDEYGELKGLAEEMKEDRAEMDRRLGDLDRSIGDYLAMNGNAVGANVTYMAGHGFTFTTGDNLFSLTIGGTFQFSFMTQDRDRNPLDYDARNRDAGGNIVGPRRLGDLEQHLDLSTDASGLQRRDVNNLHLKENRFHFTGHAFMPELQYYFEFLASSSVSLYEGYVDWDFCGYTNVRVGKFRLPFGRQNLIHISDLKEGHRAFDLFGDHAVQFPDSPPAAPITLNGDQTFGAPRIEDGVMVHNLYRGMFGLDGMFEDMSAEYFMGLFDGNFASSNNSVMPALRLAVYPIGYVPNVEGDTEGSADPKVGFGASYWTDRGVPHMYPATAAYGLDAVAVWNGLYLTAEYQAFRWDMRDLRPVGTAPATHTEHDVQRQWFIQASYYVMPKQLEVFVRYSKRGTPTNQQAENPGHWDVLANYGVNPAGGILVTVDNTVEWAFGAAYYFEGHPLKIIVEIGQRTSEIDGVKATPAAVGTFEFPDDVEVTFLIITFQLEW